jgi:putative transcriptional regulator
MLPNKDKLNRDALVFRKKVGKRIKDLRTDKEWNQDEFAFYASIHRAHIGKIENGLIAVTIDTLYKCARALEVEPNDLLKDL